MLNFHEISRICRSWKFSAGAGVFFPGAGVFLAGAGAGAGGEKPGVCTALSSFYFSFYVQLHAARI